MHFKWLAIVLLALLSAAFAVPIWPKKPDYVQPTINSKEAPFLVHKKFNPPPPGTQVYKNTDNTMHFYPAPNKPVPDVGGKALIKSLDRNDAAPGTLFHVGTDGKWDSLDSKQAVDAGLISQRRVDRLSRQAKASPLPNHPDYVRPHLRNEKEAPFMVHKDFHPSPLGTQLFKTPDNNLRLYTVPDKPVPDTGGKKLIKSMDKGIAPGALFNVGEGNVWDAYPPGEAVKAGVIDQSTVDKRNNKQGHPPAYSP